MDGITRILGIGIDCGGKAFDLDTGCVSDGWRTMLRDLDELHDGDINSAIYSAYQTQKQLQEESASAVLTQEQFERLAAGDTTQTHVENELSQRAEQAFTKNLAKKLQALRRGNK